MAEKKCENCGSTNPDDEIIYRPLIGLVLCHDCFIIDARSTMEEEAKGD